MNSTNDSNAFNSIPITMIAGPTAVGKTRLTVQLAKALDAEIISADSMQIYKQMSIGTAKPNGDEMSGIKHHMIDIVEPTAPYSVSEYARAVQACIRDIHARGKSIIITGGTGLYFHSIMYQMDFSRVSGDHALRRRLAAELQQCGPETLYQRLYHLDKTSAQSIHPHNGRRIVRALEIALSGAHKASFSDNPVINSDYHCRLYVLNRPREILYQRINKRVDLMLDAGLIDEVRALKTSGLTADSQAMRAIGYKEVFCFLNGESDQQNMVATLKQNSRRYAKRQLTWFRRYDFAKWLTIDHTQNEQSVVNYIIEDIS